MPDTETSKQAAEMAAPLWAMVGAASAVGAIAQGAVTLALGLSYSKARFAGFILLSAVISGGTTVLLTEWMHMKPTVAATLGSLTGTIPSLIVLRVALTRFAEKYGITLNPGDLRELTPPAPPERTGEQP